MKKTANARISKCLRGFAGFGLAVVMGMGIFTSVPYIGTVTAYAAEAEPTIRVGLPNGDFKTKSEFVKRYSDYTIYYNDKAYMAAEFFNTFKGSDFGITRTTTGRNKAITVTLRTNATTQQTTTSTAPVTAATTPTTAPTVSNDSTVQTAETATPLGREGYASDIEYMLSDEYTEAVRQEFYRLINAHRTENGLRELEVNLELQAYADIRAAERSVLRGHIRPDGSAAGSGWHNSKNNMNTRYAENAASNRILSVCPKEQAASYFNGWKNSDGHNKHMLYDFNSNITMAFGIVPKLNEDGRVTSAAIFASGY